MVDIDRDDQPTPLTRRGVLTTLVIGSATLSGCSDIRSNIPFAGDQTVSLPPFTGAWVDVREDQTAAVKLRFDGDVRSAIDDAPVSRERLLSAASSEEIDVSIADVTIEWSPDHSDEQTVTGTIDGKVATESWPGATWYKTAPFEFLRVDSYDNVEISLQDPTLSLRMPSGYEYKLPVMHNRVAAQSDVEVRRVGDGLFDYTGMVKNRAVPRINHYDFSDAVWMRANAEYRARLFEQTRHLFSFDWYANKGIEEVREGVAGVSSVLGKEAIESVLTSPLPSSVTTPLDVKSIHDSLTGEYTEFRDGLQAVTRLSEAARANEWMGTLTPGNREEPGWLRFGQMSLEHWRYRNPLWVTAHDTEQFKFQVIQYKQSLNQLAMEASALSKDETFRLGVNADGYWGDIHSLAREILGTTRQMARQEHDTLETLLEEFSE